MKIKANGEFLNRFIISGKSFNSIVLSKNNIPYQERELFLQLAEGDESAFTKLFISYSRILYPFVTELLKSSQLSEEIIQQTFLKLWLNREKLADIEHPRAYIFRIASNECFAHFRNKLLEQKSVFAIEQNAGNNFVNTTEENINTKEIRQLIHKAVEKLPPQQQRIFILSRQQQLKIPEIALLLHISPLTVKNSLVKSLKFIRTCLKKEEYYLPGLAIIFFLR